ncbi:MAG: acyl-CoA dehydrogenase [Actinobacteria bacterium]|nr:MAG: acyl-CoA dehydrogenase [Actinomycetota bacterium]
MSARWELFTEDHVAFRDSVRQFIQKELAPNVEEWERAHDFPRDLYLRFGELGLLGLKYEERYGGTGPDLIADAIVNEELAQCGAGGVAAGIGGHKDLGSYYIYRFGTEEQRQRWLVPSIRGEMIGALGVTEPGAGSDVANIQTKAVRDGDHFVLTGQKAFITNGSKADYVVVAARTGGEGYGGISLIVVEKDTPGFTTNRMRTVGWWTSHTAELEGFICIMKNFQWERLVMALAAVAAAQKTLESAIAYGKDREAFGRPVAKFQVWRHRFADLETEIAAARALTHHALRKLAAGEDALREVSMAKWFATELDWRVADEALQVHGGYGYMMEFPVQRAWRDARLGPIGGGTTEIMKEIIAKTYGL